MCVSGRPSDIRQTSCIVMQQCLLVDEGLRFSLSYQLFKSVLFVIFFFFPPSGAGTVLPTQPSSGQHVPRDLAKRCCTLLSDGEGVRGRAGGRVPPPPCHRCLETGVQPPQTDRTESTESRSKHDRMWWCRQDQWWGKMLWCGGVLIILLKFCFYHEEFFGVFFLCR